MARGTNHKIRGWFREGRGAGVELITKDQGFNPSAQRPLRTGLEAPQAEAWAPPPTHPFHLADP